MFFDRYGNPTGTGLVLYALGVFAFYLILIGAVAFIAANIVKAVFGL